MTNGLSFDVEDWFQVENMRHACPLERWHACELRVEKNTRILLDLLNACHCKATFFILGWIAERVPSLVKEIAACGHEIASHGYNHEIVYHLSPSQFEDDVRRSKSLLEDLSGMPVIGYRAPNFSVTRNSLWALDILKKAGFHYDSSIFPTSFHDRYGLTGCETYASTLENGLQEFPITTVKFLKYNIPVSGGGYFRLLPYALTSSLLRAVNRQGRYFIFYLHPWEIDPGQPRMKIKMSYRFRHYVNLGTTLSKLKVFLRDFRFTPLRALCDGNDH